MKCIILVFNQFSFLVLLLSFIFEFRCLPAICVCLLMYFVHIYGIFFDLLHRLHSIECLLMMLYISGALLYIVGLHKFNVFAASKSVCLRRLNSFMNCTFSHLNWFCCNLFKIDVNECERGKLEVESKKKYDVKSICQRKPTTKKTTLKPMEKNRELSMIE